MGKHPRPQGTHIFCKPISCLSLRAWQSEKEPTLSQQGGDQSPRHLGISFTGPVKSAKAKTQELDGFIYPGRKPRKPTQGKGERDTDKLGSDDLSYQRNFVNKMSLTT